MHVFQIKKLALVIVCFGSLSLACGSAGQPHPVAAKNDVAMHHEPPRSSTHEVTPENTDVGNVPPPFVAKPQNDPNAFRDLGPLKFAAGEHVSKTALHTYPYYFCSWTEHSAPRAHIDFVLAFEGHLRFFRTKTQCEDFKSWDKPDRMTDPYKNFIFGEQVEIIETKGILQLRRENHIVYEVFEIERSSYHGFLFPRAASAMFPPMAVGTDPHPIPFVAECRTLVDAKERDQCLLRDIGRRLDAKLCTELSESLHSDCPKWIEALRNLASNPKQPAAD